MANTDAAFGFKPIRHLGGAPWNGATKKFLVEDDYGTAIFVGDPVAITGDVGVDDALGIYNPVEVAASSTSTTLITGVVVSIDPILTDLSKTYIPANTGGYVNVCVDTDVVYIYQDNEGKTLTGADMGYNCNFASGSGSTVTGLSAWEVDSGDIGADATMNGTMLGLYNVEGNTMGANCILEVLLQLSYTYTSGTGK